MTRNLFESLLRLGWHRVLPTLSAIAACVAASASHAEEPNGLGAAMALQESFVKVIESAEKSVVSISRDKRQAGIHQDIARAPHPFLAHDGQIEPNPADPDWIPNEFGAGIIIDRDGLILTNYHLVRGGSIEGKPDPKSEQMIYVRLPDKRGFEARIFAADPRSDLAVLKIPVSDLTPLKLGSTTPLRKGQLVVALGNPYAIARDGSASATWGIIGNISRPAMQDGKPGDSERQRKETVHHLGTLLQIDTRLDLGTSGGALLNLRGELIGMTTSLAAILGYEKSAGFAVPFDDAMKRVIESLRQGKEVEYGFLGISLPPGEMHPAQYNSPEFAPIFKRMNQFGAARIDRVLKDMPAEIGGLKNGDLVFRVGNKPIYNRTDLMREIGLMAPGTVARVRVFRPSQSLNQQGEELERAVEVGKWPVVDEEGIIASHPTRDPWRGIVYDYSTSRKRLIALPTLEPPTGVRVMEVRPGSPAALTGVFPGDLITHVKSVLVRTPREFADAVQKESGAVVLKVKTPSDRNALDRQVEIRPEIKPR